MIHKEGYRLIFITLMILLGLNALLQYFVGTTGLIPQIGIGISLVIFILVVQFFRNPIRKVDANENILYAPADGKVVVIEETEETEYFKDKRIQVSIFMSPLNVHVNRNPISGIVKFFKYHPGKFLVAWHPKSSTENERTTMVIEGQNGTPILLRQIAGAVARRIRWYVKEGVQVRQGEDYGFIKFGSRVDIFLPLGTDIKVKVGEKSVGNKTVIAHLG